MAMSSAATGMGVKRLSLETDRHNVGNTGQGRGITELVRVVLGLSVFLLLLCVLR